MENGAKTEPAARAPSPEAYAVTVEFELEAGAFREFHRLVLENARESVATEDGCLRFDVLTPPNAPASSVLLYEIYADRAAFDLHLGSVHFRSFDRMTSPLVRRKVVREFAVVRNAKGAS